jgi:hypothetical protein
MLLGVFALPLLVRAVVILNLVIALEDPEARGHFID